MKRAQFSNNELKNVQNGRRTRTEPSKVSQRLDVSVRWIFKGNETKDERNIEIGARGRTRVSSSSIVCGRCLVGVRWRSARGTTFTGVRDSRSVVVRSQIPHGGCWAAAVHRFVREFCTRFRRETIAKASVVASTKRVKLGDTKKDEIRGEERGGFERSNKSWCLAAG